MEFPRVVATLTRFTGDINLAEELAQDALVDALHQWPERGTPSKPGAWLTAVGKRKAIDRFRRDSTRSDKYEQIGRALDPGGLLIESSLELNQEEIEDDQLRLIFIACNPLLPIASRVALTLRLVGGLTTAEIARAYLIPEPTLAQRIVRAKKTISTLRIPFEVPEEDARAERLGSVLEVLYLIFNEGYAATSGQDWTRPELCAEALRLGRVLSSLMPQEPEVHGLVALMELHSSRLHARVGPSGSIVLLAEQDRRTWDRLHIRRGEKALQRACELSALRGPYTLQAAIAACHTRAFHIEETDWGEIVSLYNDLVAIVPSPIIGLNRAVAVSMLSGASVALPFVSELVEQGALSRYHLLHSVHGDLLEKLGRFEDAAVAFEQAADLAQNGLERDLSANRAAVCRQKIRR